MRPIGVATSYSLGSTEFNLSVMPIITNTTSTMVPAGLSRSPLDTINEREMDLLFLNELHSNRDFNEAFLKHTLKVANSDFVGAWRGVFNSFGETDLLVIASSASGQRTAILVEDKIDAGFQPNQAQRYRSRGMAGVSVSWEAYTTCLFAPAGYIEGHATHEDWDTMLAYEEVESWFDNIVRSMSLFRAALRGAADKFDKGSFVADLRATAFWAEYEKLCRSEYPDLQMLPLKNRQSRNEPWPRFTGYHLDSKMLLEHKPSHGRIDLTFSGISVEMFNEQFDSVPNGLKLVRAGRSAALRSQVQRVDHLQPFGEHVEAIRAALETATRVADSCRHFHRSE